MACFELGVAGLLGFLLGRPGDQEPHDDDEERVGDDERRRSTELGHIEHRRAEEQ